MSKHAFVTAGLALALGASVAHAKDTAAQAAARQAITAQYQKSVVATSRGDVAGELALMAPDFQYFDPKSGTRSKSTYEANQRALYAAGAKLKYAFKIQSITWRGRDAVVEVQNMTDGVVQGKKLSIKSFSRDYWSPTPAGWRLRQSVHRQITGFVNGRRVSG